MDFKQLMALLATATPDERNAFKKALDTTPAPTGTTMTREQLDKSLEPFAKGAGNPADFGAAEESAKLDVTGWIDSMTKSITAAHQTTHANQGELLKGFLVLAEGLKGLMGEVAEMRKALSAPAAAQALTTMTKGQPAAGAPGVLAVPNNGQGGKYDELNVSQVIGHLRKALDAETDPMRKSRIDEALIAVECGGAIDDNFFARLGVAEPTATVH